MCWYCRASGASGTTGTGRRDFRDRPLSPLRPLAGAGYVVGTIVIPGPLAGRRNLAHDLVWVFRIRIPDRSHRDVQIVDPAGGACEYRRNTERKHHSENQPSRGSDVGLLRMRCHHWRIACRRKRQIERQHDRENSGRVDEIMTVRTAARCHPAAKIVGAGVMDRIALRLRGHEAPRRSKSATAMSDRFSASRMSRSTSRNAAARVTEARWR